MASPMGDGEINYSGVGGGLYFQLDGDSPGGGAGSSCR